jgi:hypothetical protein
MAARKALLLRIDPKLWSALEKWAGDELRSVNGQIEYLLALAVRNAGRERVRSPGGAPPLPGGGDPPPHGTPGQPPQGPDL